MGHSTENFSASIAAAMAGKASLNQPLDDRLVVCSVHGKYTSTGMRYAGKKEIWSPCPDCKDAALAAERQAEYLAVAQRASASSLRHIETMIEEAAVPRRFVGRSFENFNASTDAQQAALTVVRAFADDFDGHLKRGTGLILSGMPGTGKSHLAAAALQSIMPRHCGLYTTCMNVIRMVRGTWRRDSDKSETQVLNMLGSVPLLVLDEVGVQYGTEGEQTILFDVLDKRYRDMMPTIVLTNESMAGLKQFVGARSYDRLTETSRAVLFAWDSYRPTARKEAT